MKTALLDLLVEGLEDEVALAVDLAEGVALVVGAVLVAAVASEVALADVAVTAEATVGPLLEVMVEVQVLELAPELLPQHRTLSPTSPPLVESAAS